MDAGIRPRSAERRMLGPAFTVRCRDDILPVLRAVESAGTGDVVVVDGGGRETALAGELFARGAAARGLGGIVVDAGYRDLGYVASCGLPVYSRHVTPMAGTAAQLGELQVPVTCGGVPVRPGDVVVADEEGVVVLDPDRLESVLDAASAITQTERRVVARLAGGATLRDVTNLDEHVDALTHGRASSLRFVC